MSEIALHVGDIPAFPTSNCGFAMENFGFEPRHNLFGEYLYCHTSDLEKDTGFQDQYWWDSASLDVVVAIKCLRIHSTVLTSKGTYSGALQGSKIHNCVPYM